VISNWQEEDPPEHDPADSSACSGLGGGGGGSGSAQARAATAQIQRRKLTFEGSIVVWDYIGKSQKISYPEWIIRVVIFISATEVQTCIFSCMVASLLASTPALTFIRLGGVLLSTPLESRFFVRQPSRGLIGGS